MTTLDRRTQREPGIEHDTLLLSPRGSAADADAVCVTETAAPRVRDERWTTLAHLLPTLVHSARGRE